MKWLIPSAVLLVWGALDHVSAQTRGELPNQNAQTGSDERAPRLAAEGGAQPATSPIAELANPSPTARREAEILRALEADVTVDARDRPLEALLDDFARQMQIPIWIERDNLTDEGVSAKQPVTIQIAGITGRSALNLILAPSQLTWLIEDDVLKITTTTGAGGKLETKVYDVTDLVVMRDVRSQTRYEFSGLLNLVESSVSERSWENLSGPGTISPLQSATTRELIIRQTQAVHVGIRQLLADLRMARRAGPVNEVRPIVASADKSKAAQRRRAIHRALDGTVRFAVPPRSVEDHVVDIARQIDVPVIIDRATLRDEGVRIDELITLPGAEMAARSSLKLLLEPQQLTWIIRDEVLFITTTTKAGELVEPVVYDVADIVAAFRDQNGTVSHDFTSLANAITTTIQPDGWADGGYYPPVFRDAGILAIVIVQTQAVQEEVASFLENLRNLRRHWTGAPIAEWDFDKVAKMRAAPWYVQPSRSIDPRRETCVRGSNQFALDLYRNVADRTEGNLVLSPFGICNALGAVYSGARGDTAREIGETMHLAMRQEDATRAIAALQPPLTVWVSWDARAQPSSQLWRPDGVEYLGAFQNTLRGSFKMKIASLDYSDPAQAALTVNNWNIAQARGSILHLASADDFIAPGRLLITNAVSFNRKWSEPFRQTATELARFAAPRAEVDVAMMHIPTSRCRQAVVDGVQVVEKPYGDGDLSMVILLPPAGKAGLSSLERQLTETMLMKCLAATDEKQLEVYVPRFKLESAFNLRSDLEALGIRLAFDPKTADFSGISEKQTVALGSVLHKACVEVDEEGPPADPGRRSGFGNSKEPAAAPPAFRADRPFVFLIHDNHTGAIVFVGRVVNPGEKQF